MRTKLLVIIPILLVILLGSFIGLPYYHDSQLSRATAVLRIHPSVDDVKDIDHPEEILSTDTLSSAIKFLKFGLPGTEEEIASFKSQLEVSQAEGPEFIEITAKNSSQDQAIQMANAVVDAYLDRQTDVAREHTEKAINSLDEEIISQLKQNQKDWAAFVGICKQLGYQGPFFKTKPPELQDLAKEHREQANPLQHDFAQTKKTFMESHALLRDLRLKRQSLREAFKTPKIYLSIHKQAE